jgi:hypothetical protein
VASRTIRQRLCASLCAAFLAPLLVAAQDATPPGQFSPATQASVATLHGVVRNAATGEPLARALVRIEGDADTGALTGGDGRFEIPGVAVGPQLIQVRKPGFRDRPYAAGAVVVDEIGPAHNVWVAAEMPDVVFTLAPTGSIQGQIELSSGDPAQDIVVELVRRTVADGRAIWQAGGLTKTNSEGAYRFAGLAEGTYVLYTDPAQDSDAASTLAEAGSGGAAARAGYPSVFYPDARDPSGAARIRLRSGEQAQANMTLTLEPFHLVTATAVLPQTSASTPADHAAMSYTALVMDTAGHQLAYGAKFDGESHTVQALLPDGNYSLLVSAVPRMGRSSGDDADAGPLVGTVDFSVVGHPVANLRVPVSAPRPNPVQLTLLRGETAPVANQNGLTTVLVSLAGGWIDDAMVSAYASGSAPGPLAAAYTLTGAYWVHTHLQKGLCEASFTAGGANLAREPVIIGLSGSTAPMDLTVRDDCARLTLRLPQNLTTLAPGEEPFYTIYVVPDFDSTADVEPVTLRPSTGGSMTLEDLAPGSYHVYMFDAPVQLEYRNPAALAALPNPGQSVSLSPGVASDLVLEAPGP